MKLILLLTAIFLCACAESETSKQIKANDIAIKELQEQMRTNRIKLDALLKGLNK